MVLFWAILMGVCLSLVCLSGSLDVRWERDLEEERKR